MKRHIKLAAFALALLLVCRLALGGSSYYFCLPGEGTASVHLSIADKVAYITDGGKGGVQGVAGIELNGVTLLDALLWHGMEHLIITCSHPHSDHLDGLVTLITTDERMSRFTSVGFVDSGFGSFGRGSRRLESLYREACAANRWTVDKQRTASSAAENADAYAEVRTKLGITADDRSDRITAMNFVYTPRPAAGPHGRCVISMYVTEGAVGAKRVVDFDDADTELVSRWAEWAKQDPETRRPDVIIMPHHGSDLTDVTPLFAADIKPKQVVFTANGGNRFRHPGVRTLAKAIAELGLDNVFVTGEGDHLHITEMGVAPPKRDWTLFATKFVKPHQDFIRRQIEDLEQRAARTVSEERKLRRLKEDAVAVESMREAIKGRPDDPEPPAMSSRPVEPDPQPNGSGDARAGGDSAPSGGPNARPGPANASPSVGKRTEAIPDRNPTGPFRDRVVDQVRPRHSGQVPVGGPRSAMREAKYKVSLRGRPVEGGIIAGAPATGPLGNVQSVRFVAEESGYALELRLSSQNGATTVRYSDWTPMTLWCAYKFVQPDAADVMTYGLEDGDCSLLSIAKNNGTSWSFAIHPAIADSVIAYDGMRLDMALSAVPDFAAGARFSTYQWYDGPSCLTVDGGQLKVSPDGGGERLLRLRLWTLPEWASGSELRKALVAEARRRLLKAPEGQAAIDSVALRLMEIRAGLELPPRAAGEAQEDWLQRAAAELQLQEAAAIREAGLANTVEYKAARAVPSAIDAVQREFQQRPPPSWVEPGIRHAATTVLFIEDATREGLGGRPRPSGVIAEERLADVVKRRGAEIVESVILAQASDRAFAKMQSESPVFFPRDAARAAIDTEIALVRAAHRARQNGGDALAELELAVSSTIRGTPTFVVRRLEMELLREAEGAQVDGEAIATRVWERLDAAATIERLMRAVAVLNWVKDQTALPPLPFDAPPQPLMVDPELSPDQVE